MSTLPLFGGIADQTLERVGQMLEERHFEAGDVVCRQDEPSRAMYIIRSGEVVLRRDSDSGRLVKVLRLGSGEFFGETTLIEIQPSFASAVVDVPAVLYSLSGKDLYQLYREDVQAYALVLNNLCRELSRRLRKAELRVCERAEEAQDEETQISVLLPSHLHSIRGGK